MHASCDSLVPSTACLEQLESVDSWEFDVFHLTETSQQQPLAMLAMKVIHDRGLIEALRLDTVWNCVALPPVYFSLGFCFLFFFFILFYFIFLSFLSNVSESAFRIVWQTTSQPWKTLIDATPKSHIIIINTARMFFKVFMYCSTLLH